MQNLPPSSHCRNPRSSSLDPSEKNPKGDPTLKDPTAASASWAGRLASDVAVLGDAGSGCLVSVDAVRSGVFSTKVPMPSLKLAPITRSPHEKGHRRPTSRRAEPNSFEARKLRLLGPWPWGLPRRLSDVSFTSDSPRNQEKAPLAS